MDTTLIINPGSASKKYALYREGKELLAVLFERTEEGFGRCVQIGDTRQRCEEATSTQYENTLLETVDFAIKEGVISSRNDITRFGVRVVAPGTFFTTHRIVDFAYLKKLRSLASIAPLHIPHTLAELTQVTELFPGARVVGVSDSAFHSTMSPSARWYSIPKKDAQHFDMYRFGYHGLSVASIVREIHQKTGSTPGRMIVCHVGSGVSVTALMDGKSVDTTMGFAPTSGLMMGTRAGDVDPSAMLYLLEQPEHDNKSIERMITEEGGLKGIIGNGDLRVALDRKNRGEKDAEIAVAMYIRGIRKAIGAMTAMLGGLDALVLTGTAAERNPFVRALITEDFEYLGARLDVKRNDAIEAKEGVISDASSTIAIHVTHTNEMAEMAHIARVF